MSMVMERAATSGRDLITHASWTQLKDHQSQSLNSGCQEITSIQEIPWRSYRSLNTCTSGGRLKGCEIVRNSTPNNH
mgnify:CR=1 FL=1